MKIIDEEKAKNESEDYILIKIGHFNSNIKTGFFIGVEFAETELQNLAIEFAEYFVNEHILKEFNLPKFEISKNSNIFETFIQQRKTK